MSDVTHTVADLAYDELGDDGYVGTLGERLKAAEDDAIATRKQMTGPAAFAFWDAYTP